MNRTKKVTISLGDALGVGDSRAQDTPEEIAHYNKHRPKGSPSYEALTTNNLPEVWKERLNEFLLDAGPDHNCWWVDTDNTKWSLFNNGGFKESLKAFIQSELDQREAEVREKIEKAIDDFMVWNTTVSSPQIGKKFVMVNWYAVKDALLAHLSNNGDNQDKE